MPLESRLKCAANVRPVSITSLDDSKTKSFSSIIEASKAIGCNEKTIRRALNKDGIIKKKYLFS